MNFDVSRKVDMITSKFEWKIYDLEKHKKYMQDKVFVTSKQFYNPKCPSVFWEMRLYPNYSDMRSSYYNQDNFTYVYVTLIQKGMMYSFNGTLKVTYNIYAIDADGKRVDILSSTIGDFKNEIETSKSPITLEKTLHPDGSILLYCEIEFIPYNIKCEENIIDDLSNTFQKHFSNMYKQGILTDCVIKVGTEKINAHRNVLAINSVVFQRMFEQENMLEAKNGEINIIDCSPECFRAMLDYFYDGEINKEILEKLAYDLFAIAHKYQVKSLMDKCECIMADKIDKNNFTKYTGYLQLYKLRILEKACVKYIAANRKTFLDSKEWKNLKLFYNDKANYLLESVLKNEF